MDKALHLTNLIDIPGGETCDGGKRGGEGLLRLDVRLGAAAAGSRGSARAGSTLPRQGLQSQHPSGEALDF